MIRVDSSNEELRTKRTASSNVATPVVVLEQKANNNKNEQPVPKKQRTTAKATKKKRVVRFGNAFVHAVPRVADLDAPSVWYSSEELRHTHRGIGHLVRDDGVYRRVLLQALGTAYGGNNKTKTVLAASSKQPPVALVDSPCRGLEKKTIPFFRERQKLVVSSLVRNHAALTAAAAAAAGSNITNKDALVMMGNDNSNDNSSKSNSNNKKSSEEILAFHYRKLALPATRFARLLAIGDACIVERDKSGSASTTQLPT